MQSQHKLLTIGVFLLIIINLCTCKNTTPVPKNATEAKENTLKILALSKDLYPDFPLDFVSVFNDASDVFRKVVGKMVAKKRIIGLDSGWYW